MHVIRHTHLYWGGGGGGEGSADSLTIHGVEDCICKAHYFPETEKK